MNYIVAAEYRFKGEHRGHKDYREFELLEEAKEHAARFAKILKEGCEMFDVRIYEITNY